MSMIQASVDELDALVADGLRRGVVEGVDGCVSGVRSIVPNSELYKSCAAWVNGFCVRFDQCCATCVFSSNAEFGRYIQSTYAWFRDDYVYLEEVSIEAFNEGLATHGFYVAPTTTGIYIFLKKITLHDGCHQASQFLYDAMQALLKHNIRDLHLIDASYNPEVISRFSSFTCVIEKSAFVTNDELNEQYRKLLTNFSPEKIKSVGKYIRDQFGRRKEINVPSSFLLKDNRVEMITLCIGENDLAIGAVLTDPAKSATREIGAAGDRGLLKALVRCGFASMFSVICSITQKCEYPETIEGCLALNKFPKRLFLDIVQHVNLGFVNTVLGDLKIVVYELSNNTLIMMLTYEVLDPDHFLVVTDDGSVDYYTSTEFAAMQSALPPFTGHSPVRGNFVKFI